jgi:hypothetical protein
MGPGGMVESLRINTTSNIDFNIFDQDNDSAKYTSVLSNALGTIKSYLRKIRCCRSKQTLQKFWSNK